MTWNLMADISANNPEPDLPEYAQAGHAAIAIKASEGVDYVNPYHRGWSLRAGIEHLSVWHYHFARPDQGNSPAAEADHFLTATAGLRGPRDYVVLDLERALPAGWQHDPAWSSGFDAVIRHQTRFRTILYASRATLELSDRWLEQGEPRVWDADWGVGPDYAPAGYRCAARQFTDGVLGPEPHELPGIGLCDVSRLASFMLDQILAGRR